LLFLRQSSPPSHLWRPLWPTSHVAVRRWHSSWFFVIRHGPMRIWPVRSRRRCPRCPCRCPCTRSINLSLIHIGASNSSGFMLILQSFATQPLNWRNVWTPSNIRIWVNPISLINSSFECSDKTGMLFVTLNIVLMISCDE
jgi:hypothetical protein